MISSELASDPEKKKKKKKKNSVPPSPVAAADLIDYIWYDKSNKSKSKRLLDVVSFLASANNNWAC